MTSIDVRHDEDDAAVARWLEGCIAAALERTRQPVAICVPGGSTPFPILAQLVEMPLDWGRIAVWPNDDREVPEDHPASNASRLRALLEPVGAKVVALTADAVPPHFALCWLGMGGDGHIASLFPNTDPDPADPLPLRRIVPDPLPPEAPFARITLTIPALLDSDAVLFVIRGPGKRAVLDAALGGENDLPVTRLLAAAHQPVTCFT